MFYYLVVYVELHLNDTTHYDKTILVHPRILHLHHDITVQNI